MHTKVIAIITLHLASRITAEIIIALIAVIKIIETIVIEAITAAIIATDDTIQIETIVTMITHHIIAHRLILLIAQEKGWIALHTKDIGIATKAQPTKLIFIKKRAYASKPFLKSGYSSSIFSSFSIRRLLIRRDSDK